ncbi:MAG: nucleotidyltransferase family protein [Syntrophorhabdaceae bacterium]|nr:nucleotidyltransferase family protein [Syntrophorhabdales bacterium]MBP9560881.1 nucleotidyltransferase family protein [Syntrophorhabdaceae bacterium]
MTGICAVIFAAGFSARLGHNKLLIKIDGKTVIERSIEPFINPLVDKVFVIAGFEKERIEGAITKQRVDIIDNTHYREGMSASLRTSIPLASHYNGVFFQLGDRPFLDKFLIDRMIKIFFEQPANIIVPIHKGKKGHPVLIRFNNYLEEIRKIRGDRGLREIIDKYHRDVVFIEGDDGILAGIDTQEDLDNLIVRGYKIEKD